MDLSLYVLSTQELSMIARRIDRIRVLERKVRRINELQCNQELTPKQEAQRDKLEAEFTVLAKSFGLQAEHQRDPRGAALKLHDKNVDVVSSAGVVL